MPVAPPITPATRRQSLVVGLTGLLFMALLAFYQYGSEPLQLRFLQPYLPMQEDYYDERFLIFNAILLLWLPLLVILWALRLEVAEFGMAPGDTRRGWIVAGLGFAVMLPFVLVAARFIPEFQETYPLRRLIRDNPRMFLYWELSYGFYFFLWEWFFRGYLLFGLRRGFGWHAVWLQAVPFCLLHWGKPPLEMASSLPGGILLGLVAWRAGSFLPCFALHWAMAAAMDGAAVLFRR